MARSDLPKPVRQLILRHIDSVQQVEILALLLREPDRVWSSAEVSRTLRIGPGPCDEWLNRFTLAGLVDREEAGFRHAARGRDAATADALVECYGRRRLAVIDTIYNKPNSAIESFSDAFRMRR